MSSAVIIVGGGLSGLCCSLECLQSGAKVILVEKGSQLGGNSALASTGINGFLPVDSTHESRAKFKEALIDEATSNSKYLLNDYTRRMIDNLTEKSGDAIKWLHDSLGLEFEKIQGTQFTLTVTKGRIGTALICSLEKRLQEYSGQFSALTDTEVVDFVVSEDASGIQGVVCKSPKGDIVLNGPVVLSTGGFGSETKFVSRFRPDLLGLSMASRSSSTGKIAEKLERLNARLIGMDNYQLQPTGLLHLDPKIQKNAVLPMVPRNIFERGTLVNKNGILYTSGGVIDSSLCEKMSKDRGTNVLLVSESDVSQGLKPILKKLQNSGYAWRCNNTEEVRGSFGWIKTPESFSKGPVFVLSLAPIIFIPLGGLKVDPETTGVVGIDNCFAAGEVVGGVHGKRMIVGSSLLSCVVLGRLAAQSATKILLKESSTSSSHTARRRLEQVRGQLSPVKFSIPETEYTLSEIQKHNSEGDCWIILKNIVLDLSGFAKKHPGGVDVIVASGGCDLTENFEAFHDDAIVLRYAKDCIIGRVKDRKPLLALSED
ncbi:DEKNAAC105624 [Brettanomyces naardenensis]|uniref:DEKNAAC105624 n=1 Tax=Brettanomyces naardenensis TaxID=13370 RepID=A0A448YTN9_BRENA|nr:DEKNAAC105624 [Brettanomyces naardenensis]